MKKLKNTNSPTKVAFFAGATALMTLANQSHAQSSVDALLNKLEQKGILTVEEARQLKEENQQDSANDFKKAFDSKISMPDYVEKYKFFGDFRGRYDEMASTDSNPNFVQRNRFRYRLRAGAAVSLKDNLEVGFSLTSADSAGGSYGGNPNSSNTTMQDNGTKKSVYIDTAYGKWTPLNDGSWFLSTTIGKMINPAQFTPMVFDPDWTPEGAAVQAGYTFNEHHAITVTGMAFVEDQEVTGADTGSVRAPGLFAGQAMWNANWTPKLATSLGLGGYTLINPENLTTGNVPYINQGNTRKFSVTPTPSGSYVLVNNYSPIIADASATYKLDSFPLYTGAFPIKVQGEFINNVANVQNNNNQGYWVGVTFGKSGKKHTWDVSYRYEYLESDAVYDQLADDDNGAYYQNAPTGGAIGYFGGTNLKGHLIKANYSITDALTLSLTCYLNQLITPNLNTAGAGEPNNSAMHVMADLMWKF